MGNEWLKPNRQYTISSGYKWRLGDGPQKQWWRVVWNTTNIPKHRLISWIIMHGRLLTRVKLDHMGLC